MEKRLKQMIKDKTLVYMPDSWARKQLYKETKGESAEYYMRNAYGEIMSWNEANQKFIPVICMHGGSSWLCRECANKIKEDAHLCKENPIIKKIDEIDKADIKIIENKYPIKCSECGKTIDNEDDDAGFFGICYDCY